MVTAGWLALLAHCQHTYLPKLREGSNEETELPVGVVQLVFQH